MNQATNTDRTPFITTYKSMGGWKAVHIWWNSEYLPEGQGFWEPMQTGVGAYATEAEAIEEAKAWSKSAEIRYVARTQ